MPGWLLGFLLFVGVCVLFSWGARRVAIVGAKPPLSAAGSPPGGDANGTLTDYFTKITEFDGSAYDHFFVTAFHRESQKFVQVSVGTNKDGTRAWQFDMPLNDAQAAHEQKVALEAKSRGLSVEVSQHPGMRFLDIPFSDREAHDAFARWVVTEVFEASESDSFEITWG